MTDTPEIKVKLRTIRSSRPAKRAPSPGHKRAAIESWRDPPKRRARLEKRWPNGKWRLVENAGAS